MNVVFMGTPEYAAETLRALIASEHSVIGVFAQPDKPAGRKQILTPPPVKLLAEENGIPVFQPKTLRDGEALRIIEKLAPDIIVVVAYGKILPQEILSFPKYGCINGHASLLPKYRGASPIQWSIVCGEKKTGITVMQMDAGMDTGDILEVRETEIRDGETAGELFERLAPISAELILKTLDDIINGDICPEKQDESQASYAPILKKEMAHLDFKKDAQELECAVRGFNPWPCAYTILEGKRVKILKCAVGGETSSPAGSVTDGDTSLQIACGDGKRLRILEVQPEGGKTMPAENWLRGHKIAAGTVAE